MTGEYSEALEQQVRLHRWCIDTALRPGGFVDEVYGDARWFHQAHGVLKAADPYYVGKEIEHLLAISSSSMPELVPTIALVPSQKPGFVWLAQPLELPPTRVQGAITPRSLRAFTWAWVPREPTGLFIVPWITISGMPLHPIPWSFFEWRSSETQTEAIAREMDQAKRVLDGSYARRVYDICAAFLLFVQQRILSTPHRQVERHARRRVEHEGWTQEPLVRVVELRRRERSPLAEHREADEEQEWSCQWIVRGHWRQQFYPSKHLNQPIWITPYVKGPEDKPLKPPRATVFAVVR